MSRYLTVLALVLLVLMPVAGSSSAPAQLTPAQEIELLPAPPPETVAPSVRTAVSGDFVLVGNGVLRCPQGDEESGDNSPEDCAAATAGRPSGGNLLDNRSNNNGYFMHLADDDGRDGTFTSSRASVEIPDGAVVRHAQLTWGGHTGTFIGFSGVNCVRPLLLQGDAPPPPAAPSPAEQEVGIAVGGGNPVTVQRDPAHYRVTDGLDEPSQIYTDWADVTSAFDGATGTIEVSVSNVWAPTGPGCAGGWSLTVVWEDPSGSAPLRMVDIYNDGLPKTGVLLPGLIEPTLPGVPPVIDEVLPGLAPALTGSSVILPGPNKQRSAAGAAIGITAFDGDWEQGGDQFTVDGVPAVEPCSGDGTADFFRSCAGGGGVPPNNLSVDAKVLRPELADNDTGEIEIGVNSVEDFLIVPSVVLSETVEPSVAITVETDRTETPQGSLVPYDIVIHNDGGLALSDLALTFADGGADVSDEVVCTPQVLPALDPGESTAVSCLRPAAEPPELVTEATVTGQYLGGDPNATVSDSASVAVAVGEVPYFVERVPDRLVVRQGETVEFTVTLGNNTEQDLANVQYSDTAPDVTCDFEPGGVLKANGTKTFSCVAMAPDVEEFVSDGTMTGDAGLVTVTSDSVLVNVIAPAVEVSLATDVDSVYRGEEVELTFTVSNPGDEQDEALVDVRLSTGLCSPDPVSALGPGEETTASCVAEPTESQDVVASASASDANGGPVTGKSDPVHITVLEPLIQLVQEVDKSTVRRDDLITVTFTVTHVGDAEDPDNEAAALPVHDVQVASPTLRNCRPEPIGELQPGESAAVSCEETPDRTFDNQAFATAVDEQGRRMRVGTDPLRITVINPVLTITATGEREARHGEQVEFGVLVRNIGDVPLTVDVTNDRAGDCDFSLPDGDRGELAAGAATGVQCKTVTPTDEGARKLTNTASYTADPGDGGQPLTGADDATVTLLPGQADPQPAPGDDPEDAAAGSDVTGGTLGEGAAGGSGAAGSGGAAGGSGGSAGDLATTGASVALPIGIGIGLLVAGGMLLAATSRRRHDCDSLLYRWWPGN